MKRRRRALAALVAVGALRASAADPTAALVIPDAEAFRVAGLAAAVDILTDRYGVPLIYAANESDLFFAQGFNVARDRLFQIDLWRRKGLGELAAAFGPAYVEADRAARLFLYRGDMRLEWDAYGPGTQAIAGRFAAGINAYIDFLDSYPERLPPEFRRLDYRPGRWTAEDVVRIRSHGLSRNLDSEVARAKVACLAGVGADRVRQPLSPHWQTRVPTGLNPCLPADVLRVFTLATEEFRLAPPGAGLPAAAATDPAILAERSGREGSNNWVIAASKSATGRPVLANDPHRDYVEPSVRYLVDLEAPTLHAIGANETHLPGISIGHNESIAFGYTIFPIDQEDLYVYATRGAAPGEYRYRKGWEKFRVVREEIAVRGAPPVPVELVFSRHGPLIYTDAAGHRAFAVRTAWLEPGTATYMGALGHLHARTLAEFEASIARWGAPSLNHLYADVGGTIAWLPAGFAPRRPNWDGLMPVPGDGRFEWRGHLEHEELPRSVNPARGYITTSNEMNLPPGYPNAVRKLGFEWEEPWRHLRIDEVLRSLRSVTIDDSLKLQNDVVSLPARRVLPIVLALKSANASTRAAQDVLRGWDGTLDAASAAAALYEVWMLHHIGRATKELLVPARAAAAFDVANVDVVVFFLEHPGQWLKRGARARRDRLLNDTLAAAMQETVERLGPDPATWHWSRLHYNWTEHPLSAALDAAERASWSIGPLPKGGDGYVPNMSWVRAADFRQITGPSIRLVMDVGDWDRSWAMNFPGQSGDVRDAHYRDLAGPWLRGEYFSLLFSRAAVERVTERTLRLIPP